MHIFKNKKMILLIVSLIVVAIIVILVVTNNRGNDGDKRPDNPVIQPSEKQDKGKQDDENETTEDSHNGEATKENSLNIQKELDENVDGVDGSGSWNSTFGNNNQTTQDEQKEEIKDSDTEDSTENNKDTENVSDENVLEDDKVWSDIN